MICWQRVISLELDKDNYAVRARADAKMMMPGKCAQHVTYRCARARLAWRVCRQYMLVSDNKCLCVCWRRSAAFLSHHQPSKARASSGSGQNRLAETQPKIGAGAEPLGNGGCSNGVVECRCGGPGFAPPPTTGTAG